MNEHHLYERKDDCGRGNQRNHRVVEGHVDVLDGQRALQQLGDFGV